MEWDRRRVGFEKVIAIEKEWRRREGEERGRKEGRGGEFTRYYLSIVLYIAAFQSCHAILCRNKPFLETVCPATVYTATATR